MSNEINIKELEERIVSASKELEEAKKQIEILKENKKNKRFKPDLDRPYWFNGDGNIYEKIWEDSPMDFYRFHSFNCFRTKEECTVDRDYQITENTMCRIISELNEATGEEVNWGDSTQAKYSLYYEDGSITRSTHWHNKHKDNKFYCLQPDFKTEVLKEIGTAKLIKYLRYR